MMLMIKFIAPYLTKIHELPIMFKQVSRNFENDLLLIEHRRKLIYATPIFHITKYINIFLEDAIVIINSVFFSSIRRRLL